MLDLESLEKQIKDSGKGGRIKALAFTAEGKRVLKSLDIPSLEKAAKDGDMATIEHVIDDVLKTSDGQVLYQKIMSILNKK